MRCSQQTVPVINVAMAPDSSPRRNAFWQVTIPIHAAAIRIIAAEVPRLATITHVAVFSYQTPEADEESPFFDRCKSRGIPFFLGVTGWYRVVSLSPVF